MNTPSHEGISHLVADALAPPLTCQRLVATLFTETDKYRCS